MITVHNMVSNNEWLTSRSFFEDIPTFCHSYIQISGLVGSQTMTAFLKSLLLALILLKNLIYAQRTENLLQVHPSMVELYERMLTGNESTRDLIKILALAGKVKSEYPCRVKFNMPRKHRYSNVFKVNLHLKVIIWKNIQWIKKLFNRL